MMKLKGIGLNPSIMLIMICGGLLLMGFASCRSNGVIQSGQNTPKDHFYSNPIFPGFYPDPSICRVGEDYYLVNSTFAYFPGVPIFHSTDLVHWNQIGHVLDRPEQLDLEGLQVSEGIFAPTIEYHDGTFYMMTTNVGRGGNFIVTTKDPTGPWSNPIWLPAVEGIDPSLFFDEDGKTYVIYNGNPPGNKSLYNGHRAIRMIELDLSTFETKGKDRVIVNGGVNLEEKPVWIEGPHIFRKGEYYYLSAAEGGTSVNHSQVIFRTKSLDEPFEPWDKNPILTQRHLDPNRPNPVSATGHADLVQTQNGDWWAVFLATRPYDTQDSYNTGRETFLAPVEWTEDGWPIINPTSEEVLYRYKTPDLPEYEGKEDFPKSGEFTLVDNFEEDKLKPYWVFIRVPQEDWYTVGKKAGSLSLKLRPETAGGRSNPSYIGRRQQHIQGAVETEMEFTPQKAGELSGLLFFQNETHHLFFGKAINETGETVVTVRKSNDEGELEVLQDETVGSSPIVYLKGSFDKANYKFEYKINKNAEWKLLYTFLEGDFLSTRVAGGFVGVTIGPYATSSGQKSTNTSSFRYFTYRGN